VRPIYEAARVIPAPALLFGHDRLVDPVLLIKSVIKNKKEGLLKTIAGMSMGNPQLLRSAVTMADYELRPFVKLVIGENFYVAGVTTEQFVVA
jgi:hypothetical protein